MTDSSFFEREWTHEAVHSELSSGFAFRTHESDQPSVAYLQFADIDDNHTELMILTVPDLKFECTQLTS